MTVHIFPCTHYRTGDVQDEDLSLQHKQSRAGVSGYTPGQMDAGTKCRQTTPFNNMSTTRL